MITLPTLQPSQAFPYEFVIEPRQYQLYETLYYANAEARHLFWTMRSGKSKVIVDLASILWCQNKIDYVVVFTRKGLHADWVSQHFHVHCPVPWKGFVWYSSLRKRKDFVDGFKQFIQFPDLKVLAMNNHAIRIKQAQKFLRQTLKGRVLFVGDESSDFGHISSSITRFMIVYANKCQYRRILSGTHIGNSPLRLFTQFQILEKGSLGFSTYTKFKNHHAITLLEENSQGHLFERIEGYKHLGELQQKVEKFGVILTKKDLPDLPKLIHQTISVIPSEEQKRAYRLIHNQIRFKLESGEDVNSFDVVVQLIKLQQVLSNFLNIDGTTVIIDKKENPRLDMLFHQVVIDNQKCVVWCRFVPELFMIEQECHKRGIPYVLYYGDTPERQRDAKIEQFTKASHPMLFVATPNSVGMGRNLSAAKTLYWYSKSFNIVEEQQANERATVMGSESVGVVALQTPHSIDTYIQKVLNGKANFTEQMKSRNWKDKLIHDLSSIALQEEFISL